MPVTLFELGAREGREPEKKGTSIVSGTVINNCDGLSQGKLLVRIPSLDQNVWARLAAVGSGPSRGLLFWPQPDDEVLLAFNQDDPTDAFIIGSLWNNRDRTPTTDAADLLVKRIIKTGIAGGVGHEIEFDDAKQAITIRSSTEQKITIDPKKIEIGTAGSTATISCDIEGNVSIQGALSIELKAPTITIEGAKVDIKSSTGTSVNGGQVCDIQAGLVKIN